VLNVTKDKILNNLYTFIVNICINSFLQITPSSFQMETEPFNLPRMIIKEGNLNVFLYK